MNDEELDLWLNAHNDRFNAEINARVNLELRRQQVRAATQPGRVPSAGRRGRRAMRRSVSSRPSPRDKRKPADTARGLAVLLGVLFLLVSSAVVGEFGDQWGTSSPNGRDRRLVIGVPTDNSELGMAQEAHRYGFAYDLANWLADDLHYSAPTFYGFAVLDGFQHDHTEMLRSGQVDMFVTPTAVPAERGREVLFAGPFMVTQGGLLVRADAAALPLVEDLDGKRVCAWSESTYKEQSRHLGGSTPVEKRDLSSCVEALVAGDVYAVAGDQILLAEAARIGEENGLAVVPGLDFGGRQYYGVELEPDNVGECDEIREGIRRFITSGAWDRAFHVNMSYLATRDPYKPDPDQLDPCE
jgi:glutamate transport system substrate-binding protein